MSYGIIAPLAHGVTVVVDEGDYDARRWYRILGEQRVNVWYTAPTPLRMLMRSTPREGPYDLPRSYDLSALRFIASVGEPLNPRPWCGDRTYWACPCTTTGGRPRPAAS